MIKHFCDRCKAEIPRHDGSGNDLDGSREVHIGPFGCFNEDADDIVEWPGEKEWHLCRNCTGDLKEFMKGSNA